MQEVRRHAIAGDVYTQATDIEDERNGLIDPETGELSVPHGLFASHALESKENGTATSGNRHSAASFAKRMGRILHVRGGKGHGEVVRRPGQYAIII